MTPHAIVLRIPIQRSANLSILTDALGECARELEHLESTPGEEIGLVPDPDDPGRFAWEIVAESYPS